MVAMTDLVYPAEGEGASPFPCHPRRPAFPCLGLFSTVSLDFACPDAIKRLLKFLRIETFDDLSKGESRRVKFINRDCVSSRSGRPGDNPEEWRD